MTFTGKGITSFGFERPSLTEILTDVTKSFTDRFGVGVLTTSDSIIGQMIAISADRENEVWKVMEAIYSTQTLSGAEGTFLNDLLSKSGVIRKGQTAGTGMAFVGTRGSTSNTELITASETTVSGSNGVVYSMDADQLVSDNVGAMRVYKDKVTSTTYSFTLKDVNTHIDYEFFYSLSVGTLDDTAIALFFTALKTFILQHTTLDNSDLIYIDEDSGDLLIGYTSGDVVGLITPTRMFFDKYIADRHTAIPVTAKKKGYYPLGQGGVTSVAPEPAGFTEVLNPTPFYPGSGIESDAEYRYRYSIEPLNTVKATRDAITNALLNLSGVEAVRIYRNTTLDPGVSPADPMTFMAVVFGGTSIDIVKAIYDNMPIDSNTSGTYSLLVSTLDGDTETIKYTPAIELPLEIRIRYSSKANEALSNTDKTNINTTIKALFESYTIGDTVYHSQIYGAVAGSISFGKMKNLTVEVKASSEDDTAFSSLDKVPGIYERPTIDTTTTTFLQDF